MLQRKKLAGGVSRATIAGQSEKNSNIPEDIFSTFVPNRDVEEEEGGHTLTPSDDVAETLS